MKFTIVSTQLVFIWIILAIIQISDPMPKSNKTLSVPLIKGKKPTKHLKKRDVSELPLKSVDSDFFYGWIKCGTPGQPLRCIFDTGSSDMWVMSAELCKENSETCSSCGHYTYDKTKSRTYRDLRQEWSIAYLDNSTFSGYWCEDNIEVADLSISKHVFAEATYGEQDDSCSAFDGILGLGFHDQYKETCAFRNMMRQNLVTYPVFSFYLNRECDNSILLLGDYDRQYYTGPLVYTDVVAPDSWTIEFSSVWIGDKEVMGRCEALVDSGTSLILCPPRFIDLFEEEVGDTDTLDCSDIMNMPPITMYIDDFPCIFHPSDYMIEEEADEYYDAECMCGIDSSDHDQLFILGNVFMCKYYTVFNMAEGLVGVALAKTCGRSE